MQETPTLVGLLQVGSEQKFPHVLKVSFTLQDLQFSLHCLVACENEYPAGQSGKWDFTDNKLLLNFMMTDLDKTSPEYTGNLYRF